MEGDVVVLVANGTADVAGAVELFGFGKEPIGKPFERVSSHLPFASTNGLSFWMTLIAKVCLSLLINALLAIDTDGP